MYMYGGTYFTSLLFASIRLSIVAQPDCLYVLSVRLTKSRNVSIVLVHTIQYLFIHVQYTYVHYNPILVLVSVRIPLPQLNTIFQNAIS